MSSNAAPAPLQIRPFQPADWPGLWGLLESVLRAGETFPHDPSITEAEARTLWVEQSQAVQVALDGNGTVVGSYYLRPNSLALGTHVANAGYVVAEPCRRQGIGSRLCQHSLQAARQLGFQAMQFNFVVSTNTAGLRCWQQNGFQLIGTLPGAFRQRQLGYVDAVVMVQAQVLNSLKERGLTRTQLVISDAHLGLTAAIKRMFQGCSWQRYRVHFLRNLLSHVPKAGQDMVAAAMKAVFVIQAPDQVRAHVGPDLQDDNANSGWSSHS